MVGLLALIAFLAAAPRLLDASQKHYESEMAWFTNLSTQGQDIAVQLKAIESDPQRMRELHEQVRREIGELANQPTEP